MFYQKKGLFQRTGNSLTYEESIKLSRLLWSRATIDYLRELLKSLQVDRLINFVFQKGYKIYQADY